MAQKETLHFIGIGGIGVSAVARVLHQQGYKVQGSDVRESSLTEGLRALGIPVFIGHQAQNIDGADVVVHSTAVPYDNIEREAARERGIREAHRSEMLDLCLRGKTSIGVTGTNGKGTVSAMIAHCLVTAGRDPTFVIGGMLQNYRENARNGSGPEAVAEVDESDKSHLNLKPQIAVVNNLEVDHLNYYKDLGDIISTMARFIDENENLGQLCLNSDDEGVKRLIQKIHHPYISYGRSPERDFSAQDVEDLGSQVRFTAYKGDERLGVVVLSIPGAYNAENAAGAIAVCMGALGLPFETVREALESYRGLENRFTVVKAGPYTLVKDYISHPTGMRKVLESAQKLPHHRIFCVFKPYRFTLMRYHGEEYAQALKGADELVITKMYAAEEKPISGINTPWFVDVLRRAGNSTAYVPDNEDVVPYLSPKLEDGDMVVFFGGDDFFRMADAWASRLNGDQA